MKKTQKYLIKETWRVNGTIEKYENINNTQVDVAKYIKCWILSWQFNALDGGYSFLGFKTDNKTFAKCRIKNGDVIDTFSLKVIKQ